MGSVVKTILTAERPSVIVKAIKQQPGPLTDKQVIAATLKTHVLTGHAISRDSKYADLFQPEVMGPISREDLAVLGAEYSLLDTLDPASRADSHIRALASNISWRMRLSEDPVKAVRETPWLITKIDSNLQEDRDFFLKLTEGGVSFDARYLKQQGYLKDASFELLQDKAFLLQYLSQDPFSYKALPKPMRKDLEIAKVAIRNCPIMICYFPDLESHPELIDVALEGGGYIPCVVKQERGSQWLELIPSFSALFGRTSVCNAYFQAEDVQVTWKVYAFDHLPKKAKESPEIRATLTSEIAKTIGDPNFVLPNEDEGKLEDWLKNYRPFVLYLAKQNMGYYDHEVQVTSVGKAFWNDEEIMTEFLLNHRGYFFARLQEPLKTDRSFFLRLLRSERGKKLYSFSLPGQFATDLEIVIAAASRNAAAACDPQGRHIKGNPLVYRAAFDQTTKADVKERDGYHSERSAWVTADMTIRNSPEFFQMVAAILPYEALEYAGPGILQDESLVKKVIDQTPAAVFSIDPKAEQAEHYYRYAFENYPQIFEGKQNPKKYPKALVEEIFHPEVKIASFSEDQKNDYDKMYDLLMERPMLLKYCGLSIRSNQPLVSELIERDHNVLQFATGDVREGLFKKWVILVVNKHRTQKGMSLEPVNYFARKWNIVLLKR